jgi:hypothetical protein
MSARLLAINAAIVSPQPVRAIGSPSVVIKVAGL